MDGGSAARMALSGSGFLGRPAGRVPVVANGTPACASDYYILIIYRNVIS
jgi:hypothetical protein